ncbi:MAG: hypothetical protein Crog4KO_21610 [Crocinitomicaceae bacterium]
MLKLLAFISCVLLLSIESLAQIPANFEVDYPYFSQEELLKKSIRSVHVDWKQSESDETLDTSQIAKKRMEVEFNKQGNITYQCYSPVIPYDVKKPEQLGYASSAFFYVQYDTKQRILDQC